MVIEFNDIYVGGFVGGIIDFEIMNLNLSGVYCLNNVWSFGFGFNVVYVCVKIECFVGDLG